MRSYILAAAMLLLAFITNAQWSRDKIVEQQTALANDYIGKIKAMGYTPSLNPPKIVVDNPRSWGNYDDSANILETCDWATLSEDQRAIFANFAHSQGDSITPERFFQLAVYQWIFIHEMSHWWRACQHVTADPYENEKGANRLTGAYWREKDAAFYQFMLNVFEGVIKHRPSPVPAGQTKEKYLNDNYQNLPGGAAYSWYQSIMIVEISQERPVATFEQAVKKGGRL